MSAFAELFRVGKLMAGFERPWAFCGGWAIDLFLGRQTREHRDVDVAVFRADQSLLRRYLLERRWWLEIAHEGKLMPWEDGEEIEAPRHSVWASNQAHDPAFFELLLNERDGADFVFRRDASIRLPVERAFMQAEAGLPMLAPEIVLLYEASATAGDVNQVLPALGAGQRLWLKEALGRLYPRHPWLGWL